MTLATEIAHKSSVLSMSCRCLWWDPCLTLVRYSQLEVTSYSKKSISLRFMVDTCYQFNRINYLLNNSTVSSQFIYFNHKTEGLISQLRKLCGLFPELDWSMYLSMRLCPIMRAVLKFYFKQIYLICWITLIDRW